MFEESKIENISKISKIEDSDQIEVVQEVPTHSENDHLSLECTGRIRVRWYIEKVKWYKRRLHKEWSWREDSNKTNILLIIKRCEDDWA